MKVVLTSGHKYSGFNLVHQALLDSGLTVANLFRDEQFSAEQLQAKIVEAYQDDINVSGQYLQLNPSKLWQGLSTDLFLKNLSQDLWGWADTNTLYLLNYWQDFDPRTKFILVYASPLYSLKQLLQRRDVELGVINQFCVDWFNANTELLRFYSRNKSRCILINIEALESSIDEIDLFSRIMKERIGVDLYGKIKFEHRTKDDSFLSLLCEQLNQEYPNITALYQELESVADLYFESDKLIPAKLSSAFDEYAQLKIEHKLHVEIAEQSQQELNQKNPPLSDSQFVELRQENELLLLQLHQVQEELEHYFLQYQKVIEVKPANELTEKFVLNLCEQVDGYNWWHAEPDGRWAGPGLESNIKLPNFKPGLYQLKVEIVDAIALDIFKNTQCFLNNKFIKLENREFLYELKHLLGLRKRYPIILMANVKIDNTKSQTLLEFKFPKVISPSSKGSDDFRALAIRVKTVELKLLK